MDHDEVLRLIDRFNATWNTHDLSAAVELYTEDVVFESTSPAPDGRRVVGRTTLRQEWPPIFDQPEGRFEGEDLFVTI